MALGIQSCRGCLFNFISPRGVEQEVGGSEENINAFHTPQDFGQEKPVYGVFVLGWGESLRFRFHLCDACSDHHI